MNMDRALLILQAVPNTRGMDLGERLTYLSTKRQSLTAEQREAFDTVLEGCRRVFNNITAQRGEKQ